MHSDAIKSKHAPLQVRHVFAWTVAAIVMLLSSGCANNIRSNTEQRNSTTQVQTISLTAKDLQAAGIAFITPSSITGQEEDRQALALAFTEEMRTSRPDLRCVTLSETLSAINRAGLTAEYRRMYEDSRLTGIFDRETLQKVSRLTGTRYLAQLKLGGFHQESKGRWGMLGIRMLETKSTAIRLFLQIWDSQDGAVVWEGSQELTIAHESLAEDPVSLQKAVEASAREVLARLPAPLLTKGEPAKPATSTVEKRAPQFKSTSNSSQ
jgi:hypothetical protein